MGLFLLQWRWKQIERGGEGGGGFVMVIFNLAKKWVLMPTCMCWNLVDELNGPLIRNYFAYIHTSDVR